MGAPTTLEDQLDVLDVFIDSADELTNSWFLRDVKSNGINTGFQWAHGGLLQTTRTGPEHEAVKAVLLTLRFFCQSRTERSSIENVDNLIQTFSIDQELKDRFSQSRSDFNAYLQSSPSITFPVDSNAATRRSILDTLLYGRFAHANPCKRRQALKWQQAPYYDDLRAQFDLIVLEFIKAAAVMAQICREVRSEVGK